MEPTPPCVNPALTPEPGESAERLAFAQDTEGRVSVRSLHNHHLGNHSSLAGSR